jgi:hypothetical protein
MNNMGRFAGISAGTNPDDFYGDTVVAEINIQLRRNGCMSVAGSINDETYSNYLLDTARDTVHNYHLRQKLQMGQDIIIPAHDTAIIGTPEEKKLLAAKEELIAAGG